MGFLIILSHFMFIACVFLISELLFSFVTYVIHVWDGFTLLGLLKGFC